jgi:tripartite-type tricarboxylate transporter receptor subunit TctC
MKKIIASLLILFSAFSHAQDAWPTRTVKIVTGVPVGSGPDIVARRVADILGRRWNVPVVVENRPGAAGEVGLSSYVSQNDSHAIYFGDQGNFTSMPLINQREALVERVVMVVPALTSSWMVVAPPAVKTWSQLISAVRQRPFYGSWGVGSAGHLCGAEIAAHLGIAVTHVPYKDFGQLFVDVHNDLLSFSCVSIASSQAQFRYGNINYVASTSDVRNSNFALVPTLKELVPNNKFYIKEGWVAFFVHRDAPTAVVNRLKKDLVDVLNNPEILKTFADLHYNSIPPTQVNRLTQVYSNELPQWRSLLGQHNINLK